MNDEDAFKLLSEILQNIRSTTDKKPHTFYMGFLSFITRFGDLTAHIQNEKLRLCFFYFRILELPLRESYNSILREEVKESLKSLIGREELDKGLVEIIIDASSSISVRIFGDSEGGDIIGIEEMRRELKDKLEGLDGGTKTLILSKIASSIRESYTEFVKNAGNEMIGFYDELIKHCSNRDWEAIYDTINNNLLKFDKIAVLWKREEE